MTTEVGSSRVHETMGCVSTGIHDRGAERKPHLANKINDGEERAGGNNHQLVVAGSTNSSVRARVRDLNGR